MGYATDRYIADGVNDEFDVPFPYLDKDDVKVYVGQSLATYSWLNDSRLKLSAVPPAGSIINVKRDTKKDKRLVDFVDGSQLPESILDTSALQNFYITQEAFDALDDSAKRTVEGNLDMEGHRIINLGYPKDDSDAVSLKYVKDIQLTIEDVSKDAAAASESAFLANQSATEAITAKNEAEIAMQEARSAAKNILVQSYETKGDGGSIYQVPFTINADAPNFVVIAGGLYQQKSFPCDSLGNLLSSGTTNYINTLDTIPSTSDITILSSTIEAVNDITNMYNFIKANAGAYLSIDGPTTLNSGEVGSYKITNYSSFNIYTVSVSHGSASISGDTITWNVGSFFESALQKLTVYVNGNPVEFEISVNPKNVVKPIIIDPIDGSSDISNTPIVKTDDFSVVGVPSDTQTAARLQIARDSKFTNMLFDSGDNTVDLKDIPCTTVLPASTIVFIRVAKKGTILGYSPWSDVISCTTKAALATPLISGPASGDELSTVQLTIDNYDPQVVYIPTVSGGSATVSADKIDWTLPSVSFETRYTLNLTATKDDRVPSSPGTISLLVIPVPIQDGPTVVIEDSTTGYPSATVDADGVHTPAYSAPADNVHQIVSGKPEIIVTSGKLTLNSVSTSNIEVIEGISDNTALLIYADGSLNEVDSGVISLGTTVDYPSSEATKTGTLTTSVYVNNNVIIPNRRKVSALGTKIPNGVTSSGKLYLVRKEADGRLTPVASVDYSGTGDGSISYYSLSSPYIIPDDGLEYYAAIQLSSGTYLWDDGSALLIPSDPTLGSSYTPTTNPGFVSTSARVSYSDIDISAEGYSTNPTNVFNKQSVSTKLAIGAIGDNFVVGDFTYVPTILTYSLESSDYKIAGDEIAFPEDATLKRIALGVEGSGVTFKGGKIYIKERV